MVQTLRTDTKRDSFAVFRVEPTFQAAGPQIEDGSSDGEAENGPSVLLC